MVIKCVAVISAYCDTVQQLLACAIKILSTVELQLSGPPIIRICLALPPNIF